MSWSAGEPALAGQWDVGPIVYAASFDNAPAVTPPADTELFFANGGAGLAKNNAQLVALLATATATDVEDGSLAVTADLSALADPIPAGDYTIPLSATDSDGLTGNASFQLTVTEAAAVNTAPVSSGNYAQQPATAGVLFSFDASQNISDPGDTLTYSVSAVSWLSINSSTGLVTGTPTTAGGFTATITATDSVGQSVSVLLPVVVSAVQAPADTAALSGFSEIQELYVGDEGRLIRLDADFDLSGATGLSIVFVDPNGTRIEKTIANGIRVGTATITDSVLGALEPFTYIEYENEDDLFLLPGKWAMQLLYQNDNATPADRYHGAVVVFKVNNRPDLQ